MRRVALCLFAIVLFGCGGGNDSAPTQASSPTTPEPTPAPPMSSSSPSAFNPPAGRSATSPGDGDTRDIDGSEAQSLSKQSPELPSSSAQSPVRP
jgi:hypothetical protein